MGEQYPGSVRNMYEKQVDQIPAFFRCMGSHILSASVQFNDIFLSIACQPFLSACFVLCCRRMFVGVKPTYRYSKKAVQMV